MLQLEHMKRIVDACYPDSHEDAIRIWHDIKPVKFGNSILWQETVADPALLANYAVPEDAAYMIILRTECYTTTFDAAAPGFGQFSPPPSATAQWIYTDIATPLGNYPISPRIPIHLLCDVDEMLFAKGGQLAALAATLEAPPDGNVRYIRTLVYGYMIGAYTADKIGSNDSTFFGSSAEV